MALEEFRSTGVIRQCGQSVENRFIVHEPGFLVSHSDAEKSSEFEPLGQRLSD